MTGWKYKLPTSSGLNYNIRIQQYKNITIRKYNVIKIKIINTILQFNIITVYVAAKVLLTVTFAISAIKRSLKTEETMISETSAQISRLSLEYMRTTVISSSYLLRYSDRYFINFRKCNWFETN